MMSRSYLDTPQRLIFLPDYPQFRFNYSRADLTLEFLPSYSGRPKEIASVPNRV